MIKLAECGKHRGLLEMVIYYKYHQVVNKSDTNQILEASHKQSLPRLLFKE